MSFRGFKDYLIKMRKRISNRRLISESYVVAPGDPEGKTGTVAHTFTFSGNIAGKPVQAIAVAVVNVEFNKHLQSRQIRQESIVFPEPKVIS